MILNSILTILQTKKSGITILSFCTTETKTLKIVLLEPHPFRIKVCVNSIPKIELNTMQTFHAEGFMTVISTLILELVFTCFAPIEFSFMPSDAWKCL